MKKQLVILAIVLCTALVVAQPAPQPGGPGPGPDQRMQGPGPGWGQGQGWGQGPGWGQGWGQRPMGPQMRRGQGFGPGQQGFGPQRMGPGMMGPQGFGRGQGRGFGPGQGQGMMMGRRRMGPGGPGMFEQLGLNDDQRTKMRQQMLEHRKVNEKLGSDLRIKRWELEELMSATNQDRPKIDAKMKELSDLRLARQKAGLDQRDAMMKILTPEQREKMKQQGPGGARRGPGPGPRAQQ